MTENGETNIPEYRCFRTRNGVHRLGQEDFRCQGKKEGSTRAHGALDSTECKKMTELIVTLDISEEDRELLSKTSNCESADDLRTSLEHICTAASAEYLDWKLKHTGII